MLPTKRVMDLMLILRLRFNMSNVVSIKPYLEKKRLEDAVKKKVVVVFPKLYLTVKDGKEQWITKPPIK